MQRSFSLTTIHRPLVLQHEPHDFGIVVLCRITDLAPIRGGEALHQARPARQQSLDGGLVAHGELVDQPDFRRASVRQQPKHILVPEFVGDLMR
jgi:hypothetical protein